jgi:hypothetical protein
MLTVGGGFEAQTSSTVHMGPERIQIGIELVDLGLEGRDVSDHLLEFSATSS